MHGNADISSKYWFCVTRLYMKAHEGVGVREHVVALFLIVGGTSIVFYNGCTNFHPQEQFIGNPFSTFPQHLVFLINALVTGLQWYLIMVFICISLMIREQISAERQCFTRMVGSN